MAGNSVAQDLDTAKPTPPAAGDKALDTPLPKEPYDPVKAREETRGDLARGLLWLLGFTVAGILVFIALGRLDGTVITQSIFPSLIALAGTALGFYFGSGSDTKGSGGTTSTSGTTATTKSP